MADSKNLAVLNLGSQRLGGAVFSKTSGGELTLKKYQFVEMMGDPTVDATRLPQLRVGVAELADGLKLKGLSAWSAVGGHAVFTRFVKLPPVQGDKVEQIVEFEARQNVPFPINEVAWDYEFVGPEDIGEREVVLVAMKSDALNEINDQISAASIKTAGVDLAPMAIYNAFRYSYPEVDESVVIIDLGARSTNMIFAEAGRMFTRNILVGGASITSAISKEFGLGFGDAEQQKCSQGFVALGGGVEDHADPAIAALSKVIRNSMTRLHGEVLRTINYYRAQQGGGAPVRAFVCGGGSHLAYAAEFFQEKLKLPVEILNPLRGVQLGSGVNKDAAQGDAHCMAEMVGLALRGAGESPIEVELVPDAVSSARDAAKRAPLLIVATLCLWGLLAAGVVYFKQAEKTTKDSSEAIRTKFDTLDGYATEIKEWDRTLDELKGQSTQTEEVVNDRSYWVRMLADLNNSFESDLIWLTVIEPLKDGASITPILGGASATAATAAIIPGASGGASSLFAPPVALGSTQSGAPVVASTSTPGAEPALVLRLQGLYRKNDAGVEVVYQFARKLASSQFFAVENIADHLNDYCKAETGVEGDRHAYKFEIRLPLKQTIKFKK